MPIQIWPFSRSKPKPRNARWDLTTPVLRWAGQDVATIRTLTEGVLICGSTGSGKSDGSGRVLAGSMLAAGFGGLVLTAKGDEARLWEGYCRQAGREGDLLILRPGGDLKFNFLDYELNRPGAGAGHTQNIVNLLSNVLDVAERNQQSGGGRNEESFWKRTLHQLCRNLIDLLALATGKVSVPELYRLLVAAPVSLEQMRSDDWRRNSFCFACLQAADKRPKSAMQEHDFGLVADYFLLEYPALSERTRSVIVATFTSLVDVLNRGVLRELFCTETTVTPEVVQDGRIIVLDLPVKEYAEVGQFAQVLFKYCFQRSIERRDVTRNPRPVFLWADEAQHFVSSYDMEFQTTCRAARVATVLITQNVSNFYAALGGGDKGRFETESLFANLNTKIWHANSDPATNQWAATLIGRTLQYFLNASNSVHYEGGGGFDFVRPDPGKQVTSGMSEQYEFELQPVEFTRLATGGPDFNWTIEGIVFQNGRRFATSGRNWLRITIRQHPR